MRNGIFIIIAACSCCFAKSDGKPAWIDTMPPVLRIDPLERYHAKVFHVTLSSNKQGTIWFNVVIQGKGKSPKTALETYRNPITISEEGKTTVFFFGEDLLGNKSHLDSMEYVLDTRPPEVSVVPPPGRYRSTIVVRFSANEPCRFFLNGSFEKGTAIAESLTIHDSLSGFVTAIDKAGNSSSTPVFKYVVDSTIVSATISPREGIYNKRQTVSLKISTGSDAFFSFDPSLPSHLFTKFEKPITLPYGNTIVRYFARNAYGWESDMQKATFVIDTVPPKIHLTYKTGSIADTLVCSTKKNAIIRFTLDNLFPTDESPKYERPIVIPHRGKCVFKAVAKDIAGNISDVFEWSHKYDKTLPSITISRPSGLYNRSLRLSVTTNKPASVFFTLDGSEPTSKSALLRDELVISKEGATRVRMIAIDEIGNISPESLRDYSIDTRPPEVKVKIDENIKNNEFLVALNSDEPASIYYEIGETAPGPSSPVYSSKIRLRLGQALRYYAIDKAGNRTEVKVVDDLKRPLVIASPEGGMYKKIIAITFMVNAASRVFWRLLPDTAFKVYADSVRLAKEGTYSLEYYSETDAGLRSPLRRNEYIIDMTPPHVTINVKKGLRDSVSVFFECSKNATIYYTTDGSNPSYSPTTKTLGNKFLFSKDRLSIYRTPGTDVKLAYYAEDIVGNQSRMTVLDVFKPQAIPNVPAGKEILYDRILSVTLNAFDNRSRIFYSRHGNVPTLDSAVFLNPVTLVRSDTIVAFVVDAAGYRGQLDTFVYLIDLPPSPDFSFSPESLTIGIAIDFNASASIDHETPPGRLQYRWDFLGDGKQMTDFSNNPNARFTYTSFGIVKPVLEVKDESNRIARISKEILVRSLCPPAMVSVALANGKIYCIDKYEWPNIPKEKPFIKVSWVQAKMYCLESGKRLCTPEEWAGACRGLKETSYPYGVTYERKVCASEGKEVYASGAFPRCGNSFGVFDMVGNVWEWVEGKKDDYPLMFGGSFSYEERADCNLFSQGSIGSQSSEVGFRCCK